MIELLGLFLNNLLPIFIIAGLGVLLGQFTDINPRSLSQLILYIFGPCLVFTLLTDNWVSNTLLIQILLFSLSAILVIGGITWLAGLLLKMDRATKSSMMLAAMFTNSGNYGLPVVYFAFGEAALSFASLFFVSNICLAYTLGILIASMGSMNFFKALGNLFKLPLVYAVVLAVLTVNLGWRIPTAVERTTNLLGDATIPCMLVLLGLQLKSANLGARILPVGVISTLRLVFSPLLAIILLPIFGLPGAAAQAITLQSGMPTAVITTLLTTEYDADPAFATASVFLTTLLSPFTLTPLLLFLGA